MAEGEPLRIAFVVPTLEVGGLQRAIATIAEHLDPERARAEVIALRDAPEHATVMYEQLARTDTPVHDLHLAGRAEREPRALAAAVRALRARFREAKYDVVDSAVLEADLSSRLATVGLPTKHVTHLINLTHDPRALHQERARSRWRPAAARATDRFSGVLTDRFVAITHAVAQSAARTLHIPARKIVVVERGVDAQRFHLSPPEPSPTLRILCVGRLEPQKDHATALDALAALRRRGVDARLTIAGRGPLRAQLEAAIARHDLGAHVAIVEPVVAVEELFAAHDVFLFPSRWEGLGNAVIEAMACARPVVATDLDVMHEVVGAQGRFAPAGDAERFAAELEAVARSSPAAREQVGRALRQRAIERFDPAATTARLLAVYESLARNGARVP